MLTRRSPSKNMVSITTLPVSTLAGIIWLSGAASIRLCQVLVELGITKPKSKFHSSRHLPLNKTCRLNDFLSCSCSKDQKVCQGQLVQMYTESETCQYGVIVLRSAHFNCAILFNTFCSNLNFSMGSMEEKLISLDTALHFNIFLGTRASCSSSGTLRSSFP